MVTHRSSGNNERKQRNDDDDLLEEKGVKKKEERGGKIERRVKKREPRPQKYACVRAGAPANICAVARNSHNSSLTPGYSIFAGMRETFDAIQSNRSTEVCSFVDISSPPPPPLPPPCSIVERSMEKKKKNKQNAATLPGTRIAAIEIAR